ncbi:MAG TPA: hypothetical protein VF181_02280 [Balneolaceae bacterium]
MIEKIEEINNKKVIDEIYRLLEVDFEETVYTTNKEQRNAVTEARQQIKNDETLSEKEANEEIDKWLKG